ncbi:hypothetical protein PC9H_009410 [Pleurotus ostreatus]|uniref:Uncharacterized protein n=1 Tax=Pleurotus ostreatus TaxID=5322 RepID=A0A8H7DPK9_PLEOS|nr:uncharacterized protein PC9H_009410 [Pleurotus ostreatus]KAF7424107.1 hypothetical protein PC9H_009410 [Pleurotus ostreatus]KAJ8693065.1 hypothetical protein PTI98_010313 [Pleurotus ostreatus]
MTGSTRPDLDPTFVSQLTPEKLAFFKEASGIQDDEEIKQHLVRIQEDSYRVVRYPCIRNFGFTEHRCTKIPAYKQALKIGQERHGAIYLEVGCCFGTDTRKSVADGYPIHNMIVTDLRREFWDIGHELFKSTPESFPVPFIAGDVFNPEHLVVRAPAYTVPNTAVPSLKTLTSLNPLYGHVSVIHISSVFHLFSEEKQLELARALGALLSPLPGSVIFGSHGALPQKGFTANAAGFEREGPDATPGDPNMFCHSPETWTALWDGEVFEKGTVKVEVELKKINKSESLGELGPVFYLLFWSVTRL